MVFLFLVSLYVAHLESKLQLFEVWEMMVRQIIIAIIVIAIHFKLKKCHILLIFPVLGNLTHMCFLPLKLSHYPSRPVPIPELFCNYPTRPVPK